MNKLSESFEVVLICVIVNCGQASKLIKAAKRHGISGATVTIGKGTINNRLLDFIGLADIRKEVIFMVAEKETAYWALEQLNKEFEFHKPNYGIAFTTSICEVSGTKRIACQQNNEERGAENTMYDIITTIVDKGKAEEVVNAATKAGSKGGTILNARGSGIHETSRLFAMEIEPEKEVVLILSETRMTKAIVASIREHLKIDEPGNGIIYVQSTKETYGIYK